MNGLFESRQEQKTRKPGRVAGMFSAMGLIAGLGMIGESTTAQGQTPRLEAAAKAGRMVADKLTLTDDAPWAHSLKTDKKIWASFNSGYEGANWGVGSYPGQYPLKYHCNLTGETAVEKDAKTGHISVEHFPGYVGGVVYPTGKVLSTTVHAECKVS